MVSAAGRKLPGGEGDDDKLKATESTSPTSASINHRNPVCH